MNNTEIIALASEVLAGISINLAIAAGIVIAASIGIKKVLQHGWYTQ